MQDNNPPQPPATPDNQSPETPSTSPISVQPAAPQLSSTQLTSPTPATTPATEFSPPTVPTLPTTIPTKPKNNRKLVLIAGIVAGIGLIVGGSFAAFHFSSNKSAKHNAAGNGTSHLDTAAIGKMYDDLHASGVREFSSDKKQATLTGYSELLNGFDLKPDYFKDQSTVLIGLGIARLALDDNAHQSTYREELYLSANAYLNKIPSGIVDEYFEDPSKDEQSKQVFQKYKDSDLTAKLQAVLTSKDGVEAEVRKNLGLAADKPLESYTAIVMNFDNYGPGQAAFAKEHYMFGAQPKMWVENIGDTNYVLLAKNYASEFIANPAGGVRSSVIHEFIHAQNSFTSGDLGRTIEERRAELFSGDKSAYFDAKQLFIFSDIYSGKNTLDLLQKSGIDKTNFYVKLYSNLGLKGANNFLASWPNVYLTQPSTAVKHVNDFAGGLDGAIQKSIEVGKSDQASVNARLKARSGKLFEVLKTKPKVLDWLNNTLDKSYGMPSAAKPMIDYVNQNY